VLVRVRDLLARGDAKGLPFVDDNTNDVDLSNRGRGGGDDARLNREDVKDRFEGEHDSGGATARLRGDVDVGVLPEYCVCCCCG
jgi:hypothetical protein